MNGPLVHVRELSGRTTVVPAPATVGELRATVFRSVPALTAAGPGDVMLARAGGGALDRDAEEVGEGWTVIAFARFRLPLALRDGRPHPFVLNDAAIGGDALMSDDVSDSDARREFLELCGNPNLERLGVPSDDGLPSCVAEFMRLPEEVVVSRLGACLRPPPEAWSEGACFGVPVRVAAPDGRPAALFLFDCQGCCYWFAAWGSTPDEPVHVWVLVGAAAGQGLGLAGGAYLTSRSFWRFLAELAWRTTAPRLRHVASASLERYAAHLDAGFRAVGVTLVTDGSASDATLRQIHAAGHEVLVAPLPAEVVVVHRPQEWILRYSEEQRAAQLGPSCRALVLLGRAFVPELQQRYPALRVVAIPHGFFSTGSPGNASASWSPPCVGSVTTWGDMRYVEDALAFIQAVQSRTKVLGYLGGSFDAANRAFVLDRPANFVVLSAEHVRACAAASEREWRVWLLELGRGGVVVNLDAVWTGTRFAEWEAGLVFFNIQFYREAMLPGGPAKVEYSGTAHARADMVNVVLDCPTMRDIRDDEGLEMILCKSNCDEEAVGRVAALCVDDADARQKVVSQNVAAAERLDMATIAFRYVRLLRSVQKNEKL